MLTTKFKTLLGLLVVLGLALALAAPAAAATYYVDPAAGSNSNAGTSRTSAWASLPTYQGSASGWRKVMAGDTILIKQGSTFGAQLTIRTDWYDTAATDTRPITITPDPAWGSGPVTWSGGGITDLYISGLHIDGLTRGGIVVQNAPSHGIDVYGNSSSQKLTGLRLSRIKVLRATGRHICVEKADGFVLDTIDCDGGGLQNGESGICIGEDGDRGCSNGQILSCTVTGMGAPGSTQPAGTNNYQGFWMVNTNNVLFDKCDSWNNSGRGYDIGGVPSGTPVPLSDNITLYRCRAFNNRNDGFGSSGEDVAESHPARHYFYYCLSYNNGNGGWQIYEGPSAYLYNCVSDHNGTAIRLWGAPAGFFSSGRKTHCWIYNCVLSRSTATSGEDAMGTLFIGWPNDLDLHADYNFYVKGASQYAVVWGYYAPGPDIRYGYNTTEAPGGSRKWFADHGQDQHSLCSVDGKVVGFNNADGADFHLTAASNCIDAGTNRGLTLDFDRNAVPQGAGVDIGAFERLSGAPAQQPPAAPTGLRVVPD
jgi:hypothetical protein